jgi:cell division protein FtsI (penicillin-binding protein 3)
MIKARKYKPRKQRRTLLTVLILILLTTAGAILFRVPLSLQDIGSFILSVVGKNLSQQEEAISAETILRGSIYDRNFKELGVSYNLYNLYIRPAEIKNSLQAAKQVSTLLNKDEKSLLDAFKQPQHIIQLAENLGKEQAEQIQQLHMDGLYCQSAEKRFYPEHLTAAHLVGFSENNIGLAGAESMFDTILQPGVFKDSDIPQLDLQGKQIVGQTTTDIILSLDLLVQKKVDTELGRYLQNRNPSKGIALVMDPRNGEILSATSLPSYNPNYFWQADDRHRQDYTGHKFIEAELIRPVLVRAAAILKNNGQTDTLLPASIAATDFGLSLEELDNYLKMLGLEQNPECELPACGNSTEVDVKSLHTQETEKMYSSIQIATTVASLINGGWKIKPFYLNSIYDHSDNTFFHRAQPLTSQAKSRSMSPAMGVRIRRELSGLKIDKQDNFLIFKKNINRINLESDSSSYIMQELLLAWTPKQIPDKFLLLAIQHSDLYPWSTQKDDESFSLEQAGKNIMLFLDKNKQVETEAQYSPKKDLYNYQQFLISQKIDYRKPLKSAPSSLATMPDINGLSLRKALQQLNELNLQIQVKGYGRIVEQMPAAGQPLDNITSCTLILEQKH